MTEEIKEQEKLHHVVSVENLEGLKRKVNITIDMEGVKLALDQAVEVVAKKVQINGYRKGKAPKQLVEKRCSDEVKNVALFMLTQSGFSRACQEQRLVPLSEPKVQNADIHVDGSFNCEVTLEVKPTIVPMGYIGMSLKKQTLDLNMMLEQRLSDLYEYHCVREVRKEVQEGFEVTLDFWILLGDQKINEGKDQVFVIKKSQEEPFGENLLGAKMGDIQTSSVVLPESYPEYNGQTAIVKMDIKLVTEKVKPTADQLVKKMQAPSYEELLSIVKTDVEKTIQHQERAALEEQVVDKLIEIHNFLVPESWVADEEKYLINQIKMKNPVEEVKKTFHQMAERNVKRTFLIESIYEVEKDIKITEEEVETFIKKEAGRLNTSTLALKSELKKQNMLDGVFGLIKNSKVMDFIITNAQIEEIMSTHTCHQEECLCGQECKQCFCETKNKNGN